MRLIEAIAGSKIVLASALWLATFLACSAAESPSCASTASAPNASSSSAVLWSADMETGDLNAWKGGSGGDEYHSGRASSIPSTDVAHSGKWSVKMTISTPSSPTSGTRLFRWAETHAHNELCFSVWYYFPQRYSAPTWWNVFQWKSKVPGGGARSGKNDPFFILNVGNRASGAMYFYLFDWQNRRVFQQRLADVPVARWTNVQAHYRCAPDNTGHVTFWQDGVLLFDIANVTTRYADGDCQWAVTNYSEGVRPDPAIIYVDDASITRR